MKKQKYEVILTHVLRERLRTRASELSTRLNRSVGRLTSCDALPCPEYSEEVRLERTLAERLFYLQHCRSALETCIAEGGATLHYRWTDGTVTRTHFRKESPSQVQVTGLLQSFPAPRSTKE